MKKLIAAALLALPLAACSGGQNPTAAPATTAAATTTTAAKPDPGIVACKASAQRQKVALRQKNPPMPTMAQREQSWKLYQRSHYKALRNVGVALERAWTVGNLSDQIAASAQLVMTCASYGVDVPTTE